MKKCKYFYADYCLADNIKKCRELRSPCRLARKVKEKINPETKTLLGRLVRIASENRGDIGYQSTLLKLLRTPGIIKYKLAKKARKKKCGRYLNSMFAILLLELLCSF